MKRLGMTFLGAAMAVSMGAASAQAYDLKILHINDHHSHLQADSRMGLKIDGQSTRVKSGGFPRLVTLFEELSAGQDNVLKLHAGDAITGDLYYTLFKGEADAALMNQVCFDAFAAGNHEFDDGDAGFRRFIDFLHEGECQTPVLAANIVPEVGVSPLAPNMAFDYLQPYVIKEVAGEKIGIIGIDIAKKTKASSSPDATTQFLDEATTAQKYIDELEAKGINKIIVMTHYQYKNDLALAAKLRGADVIVGGDSHTLLGDFSALGLSSGGDYPTVVNGADNNQTCIVQAWQYAQILGELNVSFDDAGNVTNCAGTPHFPIADSFKRKNSEGKRVELEGADRDAAIAAINAHPAAAIVEDNIVAAAVLSSFSDKVDDLKAQKIGSNAQLLCLERVPGQGKSSACAPEDTKHHGADITNIVAHAFREMSITSDIAIQNGGGVRTDLAQGDVSIGDAYTLMPFANTLVELTMTGAEVKAVLEEAIEFALSEGGSTGAYPYAAGLRWDVDASNAMGNRVLNLEYKGRNNDFWLPFVEDASYKVVTNSFIASGRDGYKTFGTVSKDGRAVDTYLDYAQSFVDYTRSVGTLRKLPISEYSTQSYTK